MVVDHMISLFCFFLQRIRSGCRAFCHHFHALLPIVAGHGGSSYRAPPKQKKCVNSDPSSLDQIEFTEVLPETMF